ncbi:signal recognition particle subunit Srp14p [[Candida] railenensis]|uniref:Signal recognition particle subunit SRP14 n=1 Tax=[Candida] railenensis TaxID=45579 RepID=A0A9P0QRY2_9ASCO|nr:signal recognition particle subunit Srp14p [[Candida] railenensis]
MGRLSNTAFLAQLSDILEANSGNSSIYLTQKRLSPALDLDPPTSPSAFNDLPSNVIPQASGDNINTTKYPILVRISTGGAGASRSKKHSSKQRSKLSTVVEHDTLDSFWSDYINVIKNGFVGLKKKEKKKSKKGKVSK